MLTDQQVRLLVQLTMSRGVRPALRRAIGDTTSRQHDRADEVARGVQRGIVNALEEMKLIDEGTAERLLT
jgi:hypothetical protein